MWIERLLHKIARRSSGQQGSRIKRVLSRESAFESRRDFLAALLSELKEGEELGSEALRALVASLRRYYGEPEGTLVRGTLDPHLVDDLAWFWGDLARRSGSAFARACHGEALLAAGETRAAMEAFQTAFAMEPSLIFEFAELRSVAAGLGRQWELGYELAWLRAALASTPAAGDEDAAGDEVRELYSELLEEYASEPEALEKIRELGAEIDRAVASGRLPRALVRRGASRPLY
jgi:hypothetical protein